jgi:ABC-type antimicrobial peptide transport system permease subunit
MTMASGRTFSRPFASDPKEGYIINEAAAKVMNLTDPVGKRLSIFGQPGQIVGVVKDFHFKPLNFAVEPLVIGMGPEWGDRRNQRNVFISLAAGDTGAAIRLIESVWKKMFADAPFGYGFFNDRYRTFYAAETRLGSVIRVFSALAVLVSCLGLFGLASFMAERRTREIGIREVLGASTSKIAILLSTEFTKGVAAANLIAWPLAYLALRLWLRGYAARTPLDPGMFLAAGAAAFAVAVLTVSRQAIRAARRNPVESLRYE